MSNMDKYKTRDRASKPIRVNLIDPGTGRPADDWIEVRSSLSDEFLTARDNAMQLAAEIGSIKDLEARKAQVKFNGLRMKAALVAGWSFEEECNEKNIIAFLQEAPQIQDLVISIADDNAAFFMLPSTPSSNGPKKKSGSVIR